MKRAVLLFAVAVVLVCQGCFTKGIDPNLAMEQTKPLYEYTKPLVEEHETDPMKKEDFDALWLAWFKNLRKAAEGGDQ